MNQENKPPMTWVPAGQSGSFVGSTWGIPPYARAVFVPAGQGEPYAGAWVPNGLIEQTVGACVPAILIAPSAGVWVSTGQSGPYAGVWVPVGLIGPYAGALVPAGMNGPYASALGPTGQGAPYAGPWVPNGRIEPSSGSWGSTGQAGRPAPQNRHQKRQLLRSTYVPYSHQLEKEFEEDVAAYSNISSVDKSLKPRVNCRAREIPLHNPQPEQDVNDTIT